MSPDDFTAFEATMKFPVCTTSLCVNILINDDTILEKNEFFKVFVIVENEDNITLHQSDVFVLVMDNEKGRTQNPLSDNYYSFLGVHQIQTLVIHFLQVIRLSSCKYSLFKFLRMSKRMMVCFAQ